jgi:hypothetical protein
MCGTSIPRIDTEIGNVMYSPRKLVLPRHTEVLVDSTGLIMGYLVPDMNRSSNKPILVVCSGICLWKHKGSLRKEPLRGRRDASTLLRSMN